MANSTTRPSNEGSGNVNTNDDIIVNGAFWCQKGKTKISMISNESGDYISSYSELKNGNYQIIPATGKKPRTKQNDVDNIKY